VSNPVDINAPILGIARKWWVAATFLPSLTLMGVDATILDIPQLLIIPALRDNDHYRFQWATGCAVVGSVLGMAMIRWLRDRYGLKRVYMAGLLITGIASIPCGMAESLPQFAVARFFQSLGKGIAVTSVLATMWREFPRHKDLAMAGYAIGIYFGKAVGPGVGAFFTDYPDWRWLFYITVPVSLITFILSWWILLPDKPEEIKPSGFDFLGLGLLATWLIALMVVLMRGQYLGWQSSRFWCIMAALFVASFLLWVLREMWADQPLIDLRLFHARTFTLAVLCKSIFMVVFGGVLSVLCAYMVVLRGYPRTTTGEVLLPGGLAMGAALVISGVVGIRWDARRRLILGCSLMAVACWQLAIVDLYTSKYVIGAWFAVWGTGAGLMLPPVIVLPMEGLTQPEVVSSASIKNMVREIPSTVGSLLAAILLVHRSDAHFDYLRQDITHNRAVVENVRLGLSDHLTMRGSSGMTRDEQVNHVISAYVKDNARAFAYETILIYMALASGSTVILACLIRPKPKA